MSVIKKKLILLCVAASMCSAAVPVCAAQNPDTNAAAQTQLSAAFTIDDAIKYAKENSSSLAAVKAAEENAKYTKSEARIAFKNIRKIAVSDINSYLIASGYTYRASCFNYRISQRNTLQAEYTLESSVKNAFYTYLNNKKKEKLIESALASAQERLNAAELKYSSGVISALELEQFKLKVLQAQNNLNSAKRSSEYSMMSLKYTLNYPQDKELSIYGEFERQPKPGTLPEQAVEKSKNSLTRKNTEEQLELAKFKCDRYHTFYGPNSAAWYSASTEFAAAQLNYSDAIEKERLGIYSAYNSMVSAYEALDLLDRTLVYMQNTADAAKVQYDSGLMSANDYLDVVQQYDDTKNQIADMELSAYLAAVQYQLTFDCENTVFQEDDPLL